MWFGCYDVSPWSWVYSRELPTSTPNLQGEIKLLTNPGAESNFPWQWRRWTWEAYRWDFFFFNNLLNSNINYSILKLRPISRTYAQIPYFCFPQRDDACPPIASGAVLPRCLCRSAIGEWCTRSVRRSQPQR